MNEVERIYAQSGDAEGFARAYLTYVADILGRLDAAAIGRVMDHLAAAKERDAHIYILGNGGSAATSSHFANDLAALGGVRVSSLSDSAAVLSAIGNDFGFEHVFERQLEGRLREGDVVFAISVSGNSPNVLRAARLARASGAVCLAFVGFDGGELARLAQDHVLVPSQAGEYGPVEGVHVICEHIVSNFLMLCARDAK